MFQYETLD